MHYGEFEILIYFNVTFIVSFSLQVCLLHGAANFTTGVQYYSNSLRISIESKKSIRTGIFLRKYKLCLIRNY